jgi:uncharacterized protein YjbJ (UPF0337 family)
VSTQDKAQNAAEKGAGKVKEGLGKVTDDKSSKPKVRPIKQKATSKTPAKSSKALSKNNARIRIASPA